MPDTTPSRGQRLKVDHETLRQTLKLGIHYMTIYDMILCTVVAVNYIPDRLPGARDLRKTRQRISHAMDRLHQHLATCPTKENECSNEDEHSTLLDLQWHHIRPRSRDMCAIMSYFLAKDPPTAIEDYDDFDDERF